MPLLVPCFLPVNLEGNKEAAGHNSSATPLGYQWAWKEEPKLPSLLLGLVLQVWGESLLITRWRPLLWICCALFNCFVNAPCAGGWSDSRWFSSRELVLTATQPSCNDDALHAQCLGRQCLFLWTRFLFFLPIMINCLSPLFFILSLGCSLEFIALA